MSTVFKNGMAEGEMGRIGLRIIDNFRERVISPKLSVFLGIGYVALAVGILCKIFKITHYVWKIMAGFSLLFLPCVSGTMTYYYCVDSYMLAFLLCVIAGYLLTDENTNGIGKGAMILAALLIAISLTLYQAYICVTILIFVLRLLNMCLNKENAIRDIIIRAAKMFGVLLSAILVYFLLVKVSGVELTANRGFDTMGHLELPQIPVLVYQAYIAFWEYFFGNKILYNSGMRGLLNGGMFILILLMLGKTMIDSLAYQGTSKKWKILWGGVLLLCVPLSTCLIVVLAPEATVYGSTGLIMLPTVALIYIWFLGLLNNIGGEKVSGCLIKWAGVLGMCLIIWNFVLTASTMANYMWVNFQKTYSVLQQMNHDICAKYDYSANMKIMLSGKIEDGNYPDLYGKQEGMDLIRGTAAIHGTTWDGMYSSEWGYVEFMKQWCGAAYECIPADEMERIQTTEEYKKMNVYPGESAIQMIDNVVVVKLSNKN